MSYEESPDEKIFYASEEGNVKEIKEALSNGATPNSHNGTNTALMMAARYGNKEAVELLLESGANPNITNTVNGTALRWAESDEYVDVIEVLRKVTDASKFVSIYEFPLTVE